MNVSAKATCAGNSALHEKRIVRPGTSTSMSNACCPCGGIRMFEAATPHGMVLRASFTGPAVKWFALGFGAVVRRGLIYDYYRADE